MTKLKHFNQNSEGLMQIAISIKFQTALIAWGTSVYERCRICYSRLPLMTRVEGEIDHLHGIDKRENGSLPHSGI